jgi:hypothetical protein
VSPEGTELLELLLATDIAVVAEFAEFEVPDELTLEPAL